MVYLLFLWCGAFGGCGLDSANFGALRALNIWDSVTSAKYICSLRFKSTKHSRPRRRFRSLVPRSRASRAPLFESLLFRTKILPPHIRATRVFRLRRGRDSNPRGSCPPNTLAGCPIRPLWHLSVISQATTPCWGGGRWSSTRFDTTIHLSIFQTNHMSTINEKILGQPAKVSLAGLRARFASSQDSTTLAPLRVRTLYHDFARF